MLKSRTETIGGVEVTTTQFPAMQGYTLMTKIAKATGASVSSTDAESVMLDPLLLLEVLASTQAILVNERGRHAVPLNDSTNVDLVFSGKLPALMKVLQFVLEVNFGDFREGDARAVPQPLGQPVA